MSVTWVRADVILSGGSNSLDTTHSSARSAAMGSAFVGTTGDVSALFENPAGLAFLTRGQVTAETNLWLVDTFLETALLGFPGPAKWGGFGIAASYWGYGNFQGRDLSGSLAPDYGASRISLKAGWGMELVPDLSLGLGFQGSRMDLAGETSWGFSADLGTLLKLSERFGVGAAYTGLGFDPAPGAPTGILHLGASYEIPSGPADLLRIALSGTLLANPTDYLQAGLEYGFQGRFFLRAGYQLPLSDNGIGGFTGLTAGAGVVLSDLRIDYAYLPYGELGASHRMSVGWWFGPLSSTSSLGEKGGALGAAEKSGVPGSSGTPLNGKSRSGLAGKKTDGVPSTVEGNKGPTGTSSGPNGEGLSHQPSDQDKALVSEPHLENTPDAKDPLTLEFDVPSDTTLKGRELEQQGKYREAAQFYKDSLKADPQDAAVWNALGSLYYRFKMKDSAIRCYEQFLKLEPGNKKMREWLDQYKAVTP